MQTIFSLRRQVLVTVLGIVVARLGLFIPLPGMGEVHAFLDSSNYVAGPVFPKGSIFCLGILPYLSASAIVLLASGIFPRLRALRDGSGEQRCSFDRFIVIGTIFVAAIQALGIAYFLRSLSYQVPVPLPTDGPLFLFLVVVSATTGTMFLVWIAHLITRFGIANGVSVLFLVHIFADLAPGLFEQYSIAVMDNRLETTVLIFLAVMVAVILFCVALTHARGTIPLETKTKTSPEGQDPGKVPRLQLRPNLAGNVPIQFAASVVMLPMTMHQLLFRNAEPLQLNPTSFWYIGATALLVVIASFVYSSWVFNAPDLLERIGRYGYRPELPDGEEAGPRWLDRKQERLVVPGTFGLVIVALMGVLLPYVTGLSWGVTFIFGSTLLMATTVFSDAVRRVRLLRSLADEERDDWMPLLETDTDLEVTLARDLLRRNGIESLSYTSRLTSLAGTFGLWEVSRPVYPALVLYPRLGGGRMMLLVRSDDAEKAREILLNLAEPYPSSLS